MNKSITKEEINQLPLYRITCEINVIDNERDCVSACELLEQSQALGFDTESRPIFKKGDHSDVALIQLSTHDKVFLFRINVMGFHSSLINIFENKNIIKTGIAINGDLVALKKVKNFNEESFVEIADLAKKHQFKSLGIRSLSACLFGYRISKGAKLSNWEADSLTGKQIKYAATDAWIGLQIYDKLNHLE